MGVTSALIGLGASLLMNKSSDNTVTTTSAPTNLNVGKEGLQAAETARKKTAAQTGYQSTILTGSQGDTSTATTGKATLLG